MYYVLCTMYVVLCTNYLYLFKGIKIILYFIFKLKKSVNISKKNCSQKLGGNMRDKNLLFQIVKKMYLPFVFLYSLVSFTSGGEIYIKYVNFNEINCFYFYLKQFSMKFKYILQKEKTQNELLHLIT